MGDVFAQNMNFVHKNANRALKAFKCFWIRGGVIWTSRENKLTLQCVKWYQVYIRCINIL